MKTAKKQRKVRLTKRQMKIPRSIRRLFPHLEDVTDATKGVEVTVTARDSSEGRQRRATECALARATKREYEADGVVIGIFSSYIIKGKKAVRFHTPNTVAREITSFDRHHDFAPGKYVLSPVSPSRRLGHEGGRNKGSGTGKPTRFVHRETARVRVLNK